jgi:hypothetical protein
LANQTLNHLATMSREKTRKPKLAITQFLALNDRQRHTGFGAAQKLGF